MRAVDWNFLPGLQHLQSCFQNQHPLWCVAEGRVGFQLQKLLGTGHTSWDPVSPFFSNTPKTVLCVVCRGLRSYKGLWGCMGAQ